MWLGQRYEHTESCRQSLLESVERLEKAYGELNDAIWDHKRSTSPPPTHCDSLEHERKKFEQLAGAETERDTLQQQLATAEREREGLNEYGEKMLEVTKENIREGCFDADAEHMADVAVQLGLIQFVPYDPDKHGCVDCEPGDKIYYWGNPTPDSGGGDE